MGEGGKLTTIFTIIGGGLLAFAITTGTQIILQPRINFNEVNNVNGTYHIEFTNGGIAPATNFILTVDAPVKINNYEVFSTESWAEGKKGQQSLSIDIPRLAQGGGSLTKIKIFTDTTSGKSETGYVIFATYDQGSLKANSGTTPTVATPTRTLYGLPIFLTIFAVVSFSIPFFDRRYKRLAARIYKDKATYNKERSEMLGLYSGLFFILFLMLVIPWSIVSYQSTENPLQWYQKQEFETNHMIITIIALAIYLFFIWTLSSSPSFVHEVDASKDTDAKHDESVDTGESNGGQDQTK